MGITEAEVRKREEFKITRLSLSLELSQTDTDTEDPSSWEIPSLLPTPEEKAMVRELATSVKNCLEEAVNTQERTILLLRVLEELTLQVVGQALDVPTATVHRRETSARRKMKNCLEQKGWGVTDI